MRQALGLVTLLVAEYDEAIAWFTGALGFVLVEDTPLGGEKRWVVVAPPGSDDARVLLARAGGDMQRAEVGRQAAGRVAFFLYTDDFARDYAAMRRRGVAFEEVPREETYGTVAVFRDLYGNRWDLLQPRNGS